MPDCVPSFIYVKVFPAQIFMHEVMKFCFNYIFTGGLKMHFLGIFLTAECSYLTAACLWPFRYLRIFSSKSEYGIEFFFKFLYKFWPLCNSQGCHSISNILLFFFIFSYIQHIRWKKTVNLFWHLTGISFMTTNRAIELLSFSATKLNNCGLKISAEKIIFRRKVV